MRGFLAYLAYAAAVWVLGILAIAVMASGPWVR